MKIILMLITLIALLLVGCTSVVKESESEMNGSEMPNDDRILRELFSEENWEQMENLFYFVEKELMSFVDYMKAHDLLEGLMGRIIYFPVIHNDEILRHTTNPASIFLLMRDSPEFFDIMKSISEQDVIASVFFSGYPNIQITFRINEEQTPFTTANHGGPNFFRYVGEDGDTPVRFQVRKVREGWYMDMSPPHGLH